MDITSLRTLSSLSTFGHYTPWTVFGHCPPRLIIGHCPPQNFFRTLSSPKLFSDIVLPEKSLDIVLPEKFSDIVLPEKFRTFSSPKKFIDVLPDFFFHNVSYCFFFIHDVSLSKKIQTFFLRDAVVGKTGKTLVLPWFCRIENDCGSGSMQH